jgi:threonylcarbamoyladenosine tRNA methylthiotransferase MtaB
MPHACIGVDVIVGFPGETDEDFLETYNYLNQLDISYLHVFTYSERADTDALKLGGIVPLAIRKKRNKMLRILSAKKLRDFYLQHAGTERKVLFEHEGPAGIMHGFTDNYIKVKTTYRADAYNQLLSVKLSALGADGLMLINDEKEMMTSHPEKSKTQEQPILSSTLSL